ncbi:hypothetical protein [Burkholderia multivorans]|uniref:hypothetical protein n=1 Tax=Burkholderia multivorans TaxID=87883 RepID=UPI000A864D9F|nr:hypothetical protein [Burkholderia multivorans]
MKRILFAALCAPLVALAQTYPSPTLNSLTLQNPLTVANGGTGAISQTAHAPLIGAGTGAISSSPGPGAAGQFLKSQGASADPVWGNPTSYYNVFNSMTAAQISDVQACTLTLDVTSVIQNALNTYKSVWLPNGCYRTSSTIDLTNQTLTGAGARQVQIVNYDTNAANAVITMGAASVLSNIQVGFNAALITGSESLGQRVGVSTYSPVSSLPLQRGSRIENILVYYTGTGIYNPNTSAASLFSSQIMNLEIQGYSYRGLDIEGSSQTGSVFENLYINNNNGSSLFSSSADAGAVFGQCSTTGTVSNTDISEISINQLNVEWATVANAIRFCGVTGAHIGTIHLEEIILRNNYSGLIDWRNSTGRIGSLSVYYPPIKTTGWFVMRFWDSSNLTGNVTNLYNEAMLEIGTLNLHGLNDGPQVPSGAGLTSISSFFIFDRETSAIGPYFVRVGSYVWQTYQSDSSIYQAAPTDPHAMLTILPTPQGFNYPPQASTCGTSPTVAAGSTIYSGAVTIGTGGTSCTLTFPGQGYRGQALGTVVDQAGGSTPPFTISKTGITISAATAGHTYTYSIYGN